MIAAALPALLALIGKAIDRAFPDSTEAERLKTQITHQVLALGQEELTAATRIIVAEAGGESWLQRNWRPILMLWFAGLVGAYWMGFTAPNLPAETVAHLLDIVQVGVGGYVLGRSGEKIMREYKR